jgi:signal transduction histidine kinase/BarA-like signal transduction histidine kinase
MNSKPKILIVDDKLNNIIVIEELLSDLNIEMVRARTGSEAIEKTKNEEFALILMDIQMPGLDGFETGEIIRRDMKNILLPIIYITATYNEDYYRAKGIKTGAVDFITKPIIPDLFIGKVTLFVNIYRQRKALEEEVKKRIEAEEDMKMARDQARDAAHAKQLFLSTMSHEIRTPLNAIINTAKLLKENPRPDQMEDVEILEFSAENLMHLINDILDFSKIDAGKIEFEAIEFELRRLLNGMQQSFEYQVVRKNLELEFNISPDIPIVLVGDSARLSQILINLIGNAVKFTDKGKVLVEAYMLASQGNKVDVGIRVTDTGIGIDEDKLQVIFESFTQASSSTTRNYGGTGLGLAITKKLVELQGGVLEVKSRIGKGSIFSFVLSFIRSEKDHLEEDMLIKANFQSLAGLKVLVVEDNLVNQKIVCKFLMKWKVNVDVAENGRIAVEKAAKHMYDLVLMDLHMPEMNGYDATRLIRQMDGDQYKELPIIALTASAFIEDREKIYSYGMSGYIIKPFNPSELYWKIAPYIKT